MPSSPYQALPLLKRRLLTHFSLAKDRPLNKNVKLYTFFNVTSLHFTADYLCRQGIELEHTSCFANKLNFASDGVTLLPP